MSLPKCHVCGKGVFDAPLFRQNEKGLRPLWVCAEHNQQPIDEDVLQIVQTIAGDNHNTKEGA